MNVLALCAGVGGLELGVAAAVPAARVVCYVEREAYAAACLVARMEAGELDPAPVWSDVATFRAGEWDGVVDCVTAGYPCQPFSVAGENNGFDDERDAWPEVERVVCETRPRFVFLENVAAHTVRGFDRTCADLSALGFNLAWDCIPAEAVGACHVRDRVFVLAAHPDRVSVRIFAEWNEREQTERGNAVARVAGEVGAIANADAERERLEGIAATQTAERNDHWWRRVDPPEPTVQRMADGTDAGLDKYRVNRLHVIGNAVVPQAASHAFKILLQRLVEHEQRGSVCRDDEHRER